MNGAAPLEAAEVAAFAASLEQRGSADLVAWGRSMWPTLWPGSRLAVEACSPRDLSPGELAVARTTGGLVVHRVVASSETGVRLRGDAYDAEDMGDMEILGRVVSLHLGPARWSPPSSAWAVRAHRAQAHVVPWVRAGTRAALPLARSAYRAAVASSTLRRLRQTLQRVSVRRATPDDWPALRRFFLQRGLRMTSSQDLGSQRLLDPNADGAAYLAIAQPPLSGIVGWVTCQPSSDGGVGIFDLWVRHSHRGLGISRRLLTALLQAEPGPYVADVRREGGPAARVFGRLGFAVTDEPSVSPHHVRVRRSAASRERSG